MKVYVLVNRGRDVEEGREFLMWVNADVVHRGTSRDLRTQCFVPERREEDHIARLQTTFTLSHVSTICEFGTLSRFWTTEKLYYIIITDSWYKKRGLKASSTA